MEENDLVRETSLPSADEAENAPADEAGTAVGDEGGQEGAGVDYSALARADLAELRAGFPELAELTDVSALKNPTRYGALRDLGLTPTEAYLASCGIRRAPDTRAHLTSAVPAGARVATEMSRRDYALAKELFSDMTDSDIRRLYRRVTK